MLASNYKSHDVSQIDISRFVITNMQFVDGIIVYYRGKSPLVFCLRF
jgi:hypothetical protein